MQVIKWFRVLVLAKAQLFLLDIGPDYERVFKAIFSIIDFEDEPLIFNCDLIKQLQQGAAYHCRW